MHIVVVAAKTTAAGVVGSSVDSSKAPGPETLAVRSSAMPETHAEADTDDFGTAVVVDATNKVAARERHALFAGPHETLALAAEEY